MSDGVLVGKIIALSLDTMTCTVNTADRDTLCELPFGGEVVVVRMNDWLQNTIALRSGVGHIVALENQLQSARDDVARIGAELATQRAANAELQERMLRNARLTHIEQLRGAPADALNDDSARIDAEARASAQLGE